MMKRNQGRRYEPEEWAMFMLEGALEYEKETVKHGEYDIDVYDVEWTPALTKAVADYERDVQATIEDWEDKHPFVEDVGAIDLMEQGAPGDVYLTLDGSGAGDINYGEWNRFFVEELDDDKLVAFFKKRLGKYVDDSGGGKIQDEMMHSVYLAFQEKAEGLEKANPRKKRRTKKKAAKQRSTKRRGKKTTTTVTNPERTRLKRRLMRT